MRIDKEIIYRFLKCLNFSIYRSSISPLKNFNIDLLLDVGANEGQYAQKARILGYKGKIVSFEPLSRAHARLTKKSKNDENWQVFSRCGLGSKAESKLINISQNSFSSSILEMQTLHTDAAHNSKYVSYEETAILTLDSIFSEITNGFNSVFIKIDTQGYEKEVLLGALDCLDKILGVQIELSLESLYNNQELYNYFFDFFSIHGFKIWGLIPGFAHPISGQLLQFDAIFINNRYV